MMDKDDQRLIVQKARAQALSEVRQFESGLLEYCAPNKEIKPICTFRAKSEVFDSFVFSPDGTFIALKTAERVYLWDRQQHRSIQVLNNSCFFEEVAFSQDGRMLITADVQKKLLVWNIQTGKCVRTMEMEDTADELRTTVDGFVVAKGYWHKLFVWEIETGKFCYSLPKKPSGFDISPDGKTIITSSINSIKNEEGFYVGVWYSLDFWDIHKGECLEERRLDSSISDLVITPDGGRIFAFANRGKEIINIDLKTGDIRHFMDGIGKFDSMSGLKINPTGDLLMACRDIHSNDLHLWNIDTGVCVEIIQGRCDSSAFSPDGKEFAAVRQYGAIQVWEIGSGCCHKEVKCHADAQTNFALSPKGELYVTDASDYALTIWNIKTGQPRRRLIGHRDFIEEIVISPDGRILASASHDNTIRLWYLETGQCISVWRLRRRPLAIAFSPDGSLLAVAEGHALEEKWISIREVRTGRIIRNVTREDYFSQMLVFSKDGQSLNIGKSDVICKWDFESGRRQRLEIRTKINERSTPFLFYRDERPFLIGRNGEKIYIYDLESGEEAFCLEGHQSNVSPMTCHPNKNTLISADEDNQVYEWDLRTGKHVRAFNGLPPCVWRWRYIRNLSVSQDGQLLIAASFDGVVSFWDYESGRLLATSYALDEGYLWMTPSDEFAKYGWLHTDRIDLISLAAVDPNDGKLEYLQEEDERFRNYMQIYNDGEMVMTRINDWGRYQELLKLRMDNKEGMDLKLLEAGVNDNQCYLPKPKGERSIT